MISKAIIEAIIKQAKPADKDMMLGAFISKLSGGYSYNDDKVNHCLELLLDGKKYVSSYNVDMDYVKKNFNKYIYNSDKYIIKDIELKSIDNIEGTIYVDYKSKEKINENKDDVAFNQYGVNVSFIDDKQVLK